MELIERLDKDGVIYNALSSYLGVDAMAAVVATAQDCFKSFEADRFVDLLNCDSESDSNWLEMGKMLYKVGLEGRSYSSKIYTKHINFSAGDYIYKGERIAIHCFVPCEYCLQKGVFYCNMDAIKLLVDLYENFSYSKAEREREKEEWLDEMKDCLNRPKRQDVVPISEMDEYELKQGAFTILKLLGKGYDGYEEMYNAIFDFVQSVNLEEVESSSAHRLVQMVKGVMAENDMTEFKQKMLTDCIEDIVRICKLEV